MFVRIWEISDHIHHRMINHLTSLDLLTRYSPRYLIGSSGLFSTIYFNPSSTTNLNFCSKNYVISICSYLTFSFFSFCCLFPEGCPSSFIFALILSYPTCFSPLSFTSLPLPSSSLLLPGFSSFFVFLVFFIYYNNIQTMNELQLQEVYKMVDSIPFSRTKKNINRDFSDGVMMAQLFHHYNPKIVQLHNYPPANSFSKKMQNWQILNSKVFKKLGMGMQKTHLEAIVNATPGVIEELLYILYIKFEQPQEEGSLAQNTKILDKRFGKEYSGGKFHHNQENEQPEPPTIKRQPQQQKNDNQTQQILQLVSLIDQANQKLFSLRQQSKLRDNIIQGLQKKIQKLIFD